VDLEGSNPRPHDGQLDIPEESTSCLDLGSIVANCLSPSVYVAPTAMAVRSHNSAPPVLVTEDGHSFSVQLAHAVRLPVPEAQRRVSVAAVGTEGNPRRPFRGPMKLQKQAAGAGRIGYPALPVNAEPDPLNSPCDERRLFTALDKAALVSTLSEGPGGVMYIGTWTRGAIKKPAKLDVADVTAHVRNQERCLRVRRHSAKRYSATCPISRLFGPGSGPGF
jgi:hypothetical protein